MGTMADTKQIRIMRKSIDCFKKTSAFQMTLAVVFCSMMAATALTSCSKSSDDDNTSGSGATTEKKATSAVVELSIPQTEEFLSYFDMTIEYDDGTGAKSEKMTSTTWTKKITVKLPGKITVKHPVTPKTDEDLSQITTAIYLQPSACSCNYSLYDATGNLVKTDNKSIGGKPLKSKVARIAELVSSGYFNKTLTFTFDADGNLDVISWE